MSQMNQNKTANKTNNKNINTEPTKSDPPLGGLCNTGGLTAGTGVPGEVRTEGGPGVATGVDGVDGVIVPGGVIVPEGVFVPGAEDGEFVPGAEEGAFVPGAEDGEFIPGAGPVSLDTGGATPLGGLEIGGMLLE